jgi:hypothetical protein
VAERVKEKEKKGRESGKRKREGRCLCFLEAREHEVKGAVSGREEGREEVEDDNDGERGRARGREEVRVQQRPVVLCPLVTRHPIHNALALREPSRHIEREEDTTEGRDRERGK